MASIFMSYSFLWKALFILLCGKDAEADRLQCSYSQEVCQHAVQRKSDTHTKILEACWNNGNPGQDTAELFLVWGLWEVRNQPCQITDVDIVLWFHIFTDVWFHNFSRCKQWLIQRWWWNRGVWFVHCVKPVQTKATLAVFIPNLLALGFSLTSVIFKFLIHF